MKRVLRISLLFAILLALCLPVFLASPVRAQDEGPMVVVLTVESAVTPILTNYIERGLGVAEAQSASVVIIQLDTPGGAVDSMNLIIQAIRASQVPVVVYVSPRNAMAASAGALITLAAHVTAMAPETTIGAASPVGSQGEDIGTTMEDKVKEVLKALARNLTQNRSPQATKLAEEMIEDARAVTVDEAISAGLIDIKANSLYDLIQQLNGRTIDVQGKSVTLALNGAIVEEVKNTFIEQALALMVNPNLVFLLLSVGVQAVLIELSSPGGWVAGFVGVVCVLLAIYGMGILPVNWFGILFLVLAFVLFVIDIKAPTHGALTIAGVITFIIGALVLFNSVRVPGIPTISIPLVIGTGIFIGATFMAVITIALRAQRKPILTGVERLPGLVGVVKTDLKPRGTVHVAGELWGAELAEGAGPVEVGERVEVVKLDGVNLVVRAYSPDQKQLGP